MSREDKLRVLCYDVSDDSRRRKVARLLEQEATRVQYSVFETRMSIGRLNRLVARVEAKLGKGDSLRVYTISRSGERQSDVRGSGAPIETGANFWLM
jgi:CRISPR-associated protein Cas2